MPPNNINSYVSIKKLSSVKNKKKPVNELAEFIKPEYEEQVKVLPNSWSPEDESHEAFKDMIVKAFKDESRRKLEHICHDLAYQSI